MYQAKGRSFLWVFFTLTLSRCVFLFLRTFGDGDGDDNDVSLGACGKETIALEVIILMHGISLLKISFDQGRESQSQIYRAS
jgi:hypothetical protein